jgi:vWA-MoxR associated protein C-terminal domain
MPATRQEPANTTVHVTGNQNPVAGRDFTGNVLSYGGIVINVKDAQTASELVQLMAQEMQKLQMEPAATLLSTLEHAELFVILRRINLQPNQWRALFQASLPATPAMVDPPTTLAHMLTTLSRFGLDDSRQRLPIFEFAERVALAAPDPAIQNDLRAWVDQAQQTLQLPTDIVRMRRELRGEAHQARPAVVYIQVQLIPDGENQNHTKHKRYYVDITLWRNNVDDPLRWYSSDQQPFTIDEILSLLDALLEEPDNVAQIPVDASLAFEFIVPHDLLCYGVEQWKRKNARPAGSTIGMKHWVAVRILDRLTIADPTERHEIFRQWRARWRYLQKHAEQLDSSRLRWLSSQDEADPEALSLQLLDDEEIACLGLTSTPPNDRLFTMLIDAGIPVAIWLRQPGESAAVALGLQAAMTPLIKGKLIDLPRAVLSLRRKVAAKDKRHMVNDLTLLWDVPERIPLEYLPDKGDFSDEHLAGV